MLTGCRIELFGGLRLLQRTEVITRFGTVKAGLLLAYLALALPAPQPRERLIDLLWPDLDSDAGRNNLSTLLSLLRRRLEPRGTPAGTFLQASRLTVGLNPESVQTDIGELEALLRSAEGTTDVEKRIALLGQAIGLVRGELLPECYEDWALQARERYRQRYTQTLRHRAGLLAERDRPAEALEDLERALQSDMYDEETVRQQMRLLAALGRAEAALQAFHRVETALKEQFSSRPEAQTRALSDQLRCAPESFHEHKPSPGSIGTATDPPAVMSQNTVSDTKGGRSQESTEGKRSAQYAAARDEMAASMPDLPPTLTRFYGRNAEIQDLTGRLCARETRLVTLLGPGGAGKTRLSVEVARRSAACFEGHVHFVPLADLAHPDLVPLALQNALRLPVGKGDPMEAVLSALQGAPALLLLDNLEHLLPGNELQSGKGDSPEPHGVQSFVRLLLERIPTLTCLVTSRLALGLEGEQEYPVPPLSIPTADCSQLDRLTDCDSVSLYIDRAQLAKPDFALTTHNAGEVGALCRRLEGMPLAIEMAAAWAKVLPPRRMLERLEQSFDLLVSRRRDMPPRHRSLRAVCEWSYALLTPDLQQLFACLSLFRGGWTLPAAEAVAGSEALFGLTELQSHSLIQMQQDDELKTGRKETGKPENAPTAEPRFRMYEPLREFGLEMLDATGRREEASQRHAFWCAQLAEEARQHYRGPKEATWQRTLGQERDNLRAALRWCLKSDGGLGLQLAGALARYWELSGALREGSEILDALLLHPNALSPTPQRARALHGAGTLHMLQTNYARAGVCHLEALSLFAAQGNDKGQADSLLGLANIEFYEQRYAEAQQRYEQSQALYQAAGDERGLASACHCLGNVQMRLDNPEAARAFMEQAVVLRRKLGERLNLAFTLGALAQLASSQGRLEDALAGCCEILPIFQEVGVTWAAALCLTNIAVIAQDQHQTGRAATLLGAVHSLRAACNYPMPPAEEAGHQDRLQGIRALLGETEFENAWQQGLRLSLEEAVRYALTF